MPKVLALLLVFAVAACQKVGPSEKVPTVSQFPVAAKPSPDSKTLFVHWRHSNADQDVFQADSPIEFDMCHDRDAPSSSVEDLAVKVQRTCAPAVDTVYISKGYCVHMTAASVSMPNAENKSEGLDKEAWIRYTAATFPKLSGETFPWQYTGKDDPTPINGTPGRTPWRICKDDKSQVVHFRVAEGACGAKRVSTASCVDVMAGGIFTPREWNPNLSNNATGNYTAGSN